MDERRPDQAVSDELLDAELAALLSVEPSPDFVARVRMRVERQARARVSWSGVRWISVAAALAVAVGAVVALRTGPADHVDDQQGRVGGHLTAVPAPEVLVSSSESRVVQRLLMEASGAAVAPAARSSASDAALLPPVPIAIAPITLEPLAAAADIDSGVIQ
jgi:hypothetical protein